MATEARRADVALVSKDRLEREENKVFFGSPELVIEILSSSNLAMDLDHLREVCFQDECLEFWVISLEFQTERLLLSKGNRQTSGRTPEKVELC